jgi:SAM-dependent methyltransferase
MLRLKDSLWLQDHKVLDDVVFPCAGYIAIAGAAVRQLAGSNDFSLRQLSIKTALVLQDKAVELMTSLRYSQSTSRSPSEWYDFSIISYNGMSWTEHCAGQVKGGLEESWKLPQAPDIKALPRAVQSPYESFRGIGLHYGPAFQGLRGVSTMPGKKTAIASLQFPPITGSTYPVHPTSIDQCLQLLGMASSEGLSRHLKQIPLPTSIGQLYIQEAHSDDILHARATAKSTTVSGDVHGEMMVVQGGKLVLSVTDCHLSAFDGNAEAECDDPIAAARLSWRPDIDFLPLETLMISQEKSLADIQLIEEYGFLCTYEIQQRTKDCGPLLWYFEKFKNWIDNHVEEGRLGQNKMVLESRDFLDMNAQDRMKLIEELRARLQTSQFINVAELITRLMDNCVGVFEGTKEILDIYIRDDGLTKLYGITGDRIDSSEFFVALGHTNPTLRVLEIGAGTGGTTQVALSALTSVNQEPMYSRYTFTDISSGFFAAASERFAKYPGIEFKTLDASRDPAEQGFEMGTYDLIVASNVIHATNELKTTLRNVRRLLHPRGRFFLQELTPAPAKMINIIMGPLPGWWLGEADGRANEPIVSTDRWNQELLAAGFSGIECAVHDDPNLDASIGVNIIARPWRKDSEYLSVTLLIQRSQLEADYFKLMHQKFSTEGYHVDVCMLGDVLPPYQDIVSLIEVEEPFFDKVSAEKFELFQQLIACLGSSRLLWVAGSSQMEPQDPEYSLTLGLSRSIRAELNVPLAIVEVDAFDTTTSDTVLKILEKYQDTASSVNPECEFAIKKGIVHVGRYHWAKISEELAASNDVGGHTLRLGPSKKGVLNVSSWIPEPRALVGPEEVIVSPRYIGLNLEVSEQSL